MGAPFSIIIPVLREETVIGSAVGRVRSLAGGEEAEIIVVEWRSGRGNSAGGPRRCGSEGPLGEGKGAPAQPGAPKVPPGGSFSSFTPTRSSRWMPSDGSPGS